MRYVVVNLLILILAGATSPIEVGDVAWSRDLSAALAASGESGKPVLVLFQEVPGCAGCQRFGREVLTQPLLVEAIEDEFHPVLVYNNRGGDDARLLKTFGEPAWNFQVIRFLGADGEDVIPRRDRVWATAAVAARLIAAIEAVKRPVPEYLRILALEADTARQAQAAFAMHCFWTGEYTLGQLEGVISTEAGWLEGREVTLVTYAPETLSLDRLVAHAKKAKCAQKLYLPEDAAADGGGGLEAGTLDERYRAASAADQKRQLTRWPEILTVPDLTPMQLTKINALASKNREAALAILSPRQRAALP